MSPGLKSPRLLFVGGGSGGHTAPLLVIMAAVQKVAAAKKIDLRCDYVGTKGDVESPTISSSALPFTKHAIRAGKLNRFVTWRHLKELKGFLVGLLDAQKLITKLHPDLVMAKGGAVSVPVAWAAKRAGIPIFCHETDIRPGLANRIVSKWATNIFTAYPIGQYPTLEKSRLRYVGQPVRPEFFQKNTGKVFIEEKEVIDDLPLVTVIGGSQGARKVNQLVSEEWEELLKRVRLVHQVGASDIADLRNKAAKLPQNVRSHLHLTAFITEGMPELLQRSALVISRAGGSIAELAAAGAPTVLLPLTGSAQDHQWANARMLESKGSAIVCDEEQISARELREVVEGLLNDPAKRKGLSEKIQTMAQPNAAAHIAEELIKNL